MNKEEWLKKRTRGIGGSDCACILGLNPYKSKIQLWEEKVGLAPHTGVHNDATTYGNLAEEHIISLFALDYPQYKVTHTDFDIMANDEKEYIQGSFDGRLFERKTGRKGVLEIKTCTIRNATMLEKWKGNNIPDNYFCQVLHYMLVNPEFEFAKLRAYLRFEEIKELNKAFRGEIRDYTIERKEVEEDLKILKEKEVDFWENYVIPKRRPNEVINFD